VARWVAGSGPLRCEEFSLTSKRRPRTLPRRARARLVLPGLRPGELRGFVLTQA
jgi:hypothetical protein